MTLQLFPLETSPKTFETMQKLAVAELSLSGGVAQRAGEVANDSTSPPAVAEAAKKVSESFWKLNNTTQNVLNVARPFDRDDLNFKESAYLLWGEITDPGRVFIASQANPAFFFMLIGLWAGLIYYVDLATKSWIGLLGKLWVGTVHFMAHMAALLFVNQIGALVMFAASVIVGAAVILVLLAVLAPALLVFVIAIGAIFGLIFYKVGAFDLLHMLGSALMNIPFLPDLIALGWKAYEGLKTLSGPLQSALGYVIDILKLPLTIFGPEVIWALAFAIVSILLGGLVGALIFGLYWTIMSTLFAKHTGDAFGALGIANYKHFLRMHFEKDRLTIYPIAIDHVPGRRGWRTFAANELRPSHNPQIKPKVPLQPHLIDGPIVINAGAIKA